MINSISLRNWKSFNKMEFKFESINIIIGANASGKTNFLEALELLKKQASNNSIDKINEIRGGINYFKTFEKDKFFLSAKVTQNEKINTYSIKSGDDSKIIETIKNNSQSNSKFKSDLFINDSSINEFRDLLLKRDDQKLDYSNFIHFIDRNYKKNAEESQKTSEQLKEEISKITIIDPIPREIRGKTKASKSKELNKDCGNLIDYIFNSNKKLEIEKKLLPYLNQLVETEITNVEFKEVGDNKEDTQLYIKEAGNAQKLHSDIISDGTLRFISIIGSLLAQPSGTIFAVEEVDNGIAPAKTKLLIDIIDNISFEQNIDVVLTTHNTSLMNYLSKKLFNYISFAYRKDSGYTDIKRLRDLPGLSKLMSYGEVGELMENNKILQYIKNNGDKNV